MNDKALAAALQGDHRPRLIVHVVWHPDSAGAAKLAERIHSEFTRDPAQPGVRGLGIPVFFRSVAESGESVPPAIDLEKAHHTAVVVLVDSGMVLARDAGWAAYLEDIWSRVGKRHRLIPVAMTNGAFNLSDTIAEVNYVRLQGLEEEEAAGILRNRLMNDFARLLTVRPAVAEVIDHAAVEEVPRMKLFISHAKKDGEKAAIAIRDYVRAKLPLNTFFDAVEIEAGFKFENQINAGIDDAALAVVHTDAYASRIWCQHEILRAKRKARPVVVIHAIENGEARSFPYLGNVPTIRWRAPEEAKPDGNLRDIVGLVLREILRAEYFTRHFDDLRELFGVPDSVRVLPRAPELLTCLALRPLRGSVPYFVYPDPPLSKQEFDLMADLDPELKLTTPILLFSKPRQSYATLESSQRLAGAGWRIGLSISDSPDLAVRGFGKSHLDDAMSEFARFFLSAGAILAYGGDMRQGGFTTVLLELQASYRAITGEATNAVRCYLAWPISTDLSNDQEAELIHAASFVKVPPRGIAEGDRAGVRSMKDFPPTTAMNRVVWARSLTAMRERMNGEIDARLLMGGQSRGLGRYPGLAEEALLALRSKKPVFLIGAFGGCALAVIEALQGQPSPVLTREFQAAGKFDQETVDLYHATAGPGEERIDYPELVKEFAGFGVGGLNNGLSDEENLRLFETDQLLEMIALVLRGLWNLKNPPAGGAGG